MFDLGLMRAPSQMERKRAEVAAEERRKGDPFQLGSWVVVKNVAMMDEDLTYYDGAIGEVIAPLEPNFRHVKFITEKSWVSKCFPMKSLASVRDTVGIIVENDVCWDSDKHMKLAEHISEIEDYTYWHHDGPSVPEWYLHSLKTSVRYWRIPADYARIPPMGLVGAESRFVHFTPRKGYLELIIQSDGQVYASELEAFSVIVNSVKDILPTGQRATMSFFEAKAYMGGKIARCCAVFHITNAFEVPDVTIDASHEPTIVREGHVLESTIARHVSQYLCE
jgi:hypothetical protein